MSDFLFILFGGAAVGSAFVAATAPRIVYAGIGLLGTLLSVGALYAVLGADFLAATQILVYIGAILVLLVFVILLTGRVLERVGLEGKSSALYGGLAGVVVFGGLLYAILATEWAPPGEVLAEPQPTTAALGRALLDPQRYLVPFELASVLLLAALVGAAYLVRRRREG